MHVAWHFFKIPTIITITVLVQYNGITLSPNPHVVYKELTKKYLQLFRAGAVGRVINMRKVQFQYVTLHSFKFI